MLLCIHVVRTGKEDTICANNPMVTAPQQIEICILKRMQRSCWPHKIERETYYNAVT